MNRRNNSKRPVESFLAGDASSAYYNTAGAGNALTDATTKAVVLGDHQIGMFSTSILGTTGLYIATPAAPTIADAPVISFFQGTSGSANPNVNPYGYPLWNRVYEKGGDIDGRERIVATRQNYAAPTFSTYIVGGTGGQIVPLDTTDYTMKISFRGNHVDELNNTNGSMSLIINQTTPDFTALGTADTLDWFVQNVVWKINRNSQEINIDNPHLKGNYPVYAIALDSTATNGVAASGLTPGFLGLVNTTYGIKGITLSQEQIDSINAGIAAAGLPGTTTVMVSDLTTAGTLTADAILIQALDRIPTYLDRTSTFKSRLLIGLTTGFDWNVVYHQEVEKAYEGEGLGRQVDKQYQATQGQRKYSTKHNEYPLIEFPSPIDTTLNYHQLIIESEQSRQIDEGNVSVSPQKTIIAMPTANVAQLDALQTAFNTWLASGNNVPVQVN